MRHESQTPSEIGSASAFWSSDFEAGTREHMRQKYVALLAIAEMPAMPEGPRRLALRRAATQWPGCLREAELAGPDVCARRARALAGEDDVRTRAWWRERGEMGLVLWADLHVLLADVLSWRRSVSRASRDAVGDVRSFATFLIERDEGVTDVDPDRLAHAPRKGARWPSMEYLAMYGASKVSSRTAYACLAHRADMDLTSMMRALFERTGPWEHRMGARAWTIR